MKQLVFVMVVTFFVFSGAAAQTPTSDGGSSFPPPNAATNAPAASKISDIGEGRRWSFYVTLRGIGDSNINHDSDDVNDYGAILGAGIYFRNRPERPNFEFTYEIGRHTYSRTARWDRTSHFFQVRSENRLGKRWVSETTGEVSLKGSTEDRELTDRYSVIQFFQFRLTRKNRINLGGAYRLKRYSSALSQRNSKNPYLEASYERRFNKSRSKLEFSYRYEDNTARDERYSYIRWSYGAQLSTPLFRRDNLSISAYYRPQKYSRIIEIDVPNAPDILATRRDKRWILGGEWRRPLWRGLELNLFYKYEQRNSNDIDRNFKAHLAGFGLTYRWWL